MTSLPNTTHKTNDQVFASLGVRVGLEIHQQLATGRKLFCGCVPTEPKEYPITFQRRLRSSVGELGSHDPAALFEGAKDKIVTYYANSDSSCLLEQDEEPPHEIDAVAKRVALTIALTLKSRAYTELHPMRKTVVDGSNTSGFQRTMLISEGGSFLVSDDTAGNAVAKTTTATAAKTTATIGIQSICLEEDASKIIDVNNSNNTQSTKGYGLERLGVPLVEIATEPFKVSDPKTVKAVALSLGRILRSTGMVTRGLGSIRQDVNVSITAGNDAVVEVKGVQQLEQLESVVAYEARRQHGLLAISEKLHQCGWSHDASTDKADAAGALDRCSSKIIKKAMHRGDAITAVAFRGMDGIFGYEPYKDVRLGKEIAELVRLFGVGGIFHSDELPAYGITEQDLAGIAVLLEASDNDAFLILAAPHQKTDTIIRQIVSRIELIARKGIPEDTRLATQDGKTSFLRPRPGAARMYPETDVPTITITQDELDGAAADIPKPWDESIADLQSRHGINAQLAEQLWDSARLKLFEDIVSRQDGVNPTFVASVLCSSITSLGRQGLDSGRLDDDMIHETFDLLNRGKIAKESVEMIFQSIMSGETDAVEKAVKATAAQSIDKDELGEITARIIQQNMELVKKQGERAVGPLMGIAMKELRGKASGQAINTLIVEGIKDALED